MDQEAYEDESELGVESSADYGAEEVDEMLDSLLEGDAEEDLSERRRRRRGRRGTPVQQRPVPTATGRPAYQAPMTQTYVTQGQLKDALGRVGTDIRRNADGIKAVNTQLGRLGGQVRDVVAVNGVQNGRINKLDKQLQLDGALDFAQSLKFEKQTTGTGTSATTTTNLVLDPLAILKGALKTGMLGNPKGAFANPAVVGGLGLLLNNLTGIGSLVGVGVKP